MAIVSVRYIVDDVDTAIEFYTKLTELASVRYFIDHARAAVDFYAIHLGFAVALTHGAIGITSGRARAIVAAVVGLISLVVGGWLWPAQPVVSAPATGEPGPSWPWCWGLSA